MSYIKSLATLSFIGYLPAPGTCGSLVAFLLLYFTHAHMYNLYLFVVSLLIVFSYFIVANALSFFDTQDPPEIVIDEFVGCFIALYGAFTGVISVLFAFILYRLLDIYKPLGITSIEKLPGAYGIVLDDVLAGLYANIVLHGLCYFL